MTVATAALCSGVLAWVLYEASGGATRRWLVWIASLGVFWLWFLWTMFRDARDLREVERTLHREGVAIPDEERTAFKLAESRESLVASLVALMLIALAFVAHFAGWIGVGR